NLPSYNPNAVESGARDAHRNRAVTDLLEPGSTMKPITVAAALEAGVITPQTKFNTNPGWIPNGRYRTTDTHNYGVLDTTGVITKSSNVGASMIAERLSKSAFYEYVRKLGYGRSTGSGFPGEAAGIFPTPDRWDGTTKQTMSYGYALSATPLQIATAYAALSNGGKLIAPTFVKGQSNPARQVMDPTVAREVVRMMETVTLPGGTAINAHILGYRVAGKTGTARKASGGGYSRRYVAYFAGIVPASNPRFSMVVVVNDPNPSKGWIYGTGGYVAAPVFHNVMDGALRLMDVAPDDLDAWLAAQAAAEAKKQAGVKPIAAPVAALDAGSHSEALQ
ncbi:MAG TPA: penicillin-binding protein 2, partial [Lysobacter sp.]|nr:penicillin-binding protein 2 [Lysobacter sp.]